MSGPNEDLIRKLFDVYRSGDREGAVGLFAEDAVFRYQGPGALHGDHRGREAILRFWAEQDRLSGGTFRPEMLDLVAGDRNVYLLVRIAPDDAKRSWMRVVVYEVLNGAIVGARVFEDDPTSADVFFSSGGGAG